MINVDVAVVGAGFAGIGIGIRLKRRGHNSFVILERAQTVGGTWRDNSYPGVACDVPSHLYCYSFRPNPHWSAFYSPGHEIRTYLENCVKDEGLLENIRFGTDVRGAVWNEAQSRWILRTSTGVVAARAVVFAAGRLTEPRIPNVPGVSAFAGVSFHSARWDHTIDLKGKRVAVVGSGASAIQIVPHLAKEAAHLVVLQRSPPYVIPRVSDLYTDAQRLLYLRDPEELARLRSRLFWKAEEAFAQRIGSSAHIAAAREIALGHLAAQVPDVALRSKLTPSYEIGCKRVLISNDYYPALSRSNVTLDPAALAYIEENTLVTASGSRHEVDAVIFATGFHAAQQPYATAVTGINGKLLADHWSHGMTAYASTVVHNFPNLFIINGPNAGLGHNSAIFMIEAQINYILGALTHLAADPERILNVTSKAEQSYTMLIDELSAKTVWMTGGCSSWYKDPRSGRLTLLWPDFASAFQDRNGEFCPVAFDP